MTALQKKFLRIISVFFILIASLCFAQKTDMKAYEGGWLGRFDSSDVFSFTVNIEKQNGLNYSFQILNKNISLKKDFEKKPNGILRVSIDTNFSFTGYEEQNNIEGFIQSGIMKYHITLVKDQNIFSGKFNLFAVKDLSSELFLSIENAAGEKYEAYTVPGDSRIPRMMNYDFQKRNDTIFFKDFRTGLNFAGKLTPSKIFLDAKLFGKTVAKTELNKFEEKWTADNSYTKIISENESPLELNDGWKISNLKQQGFDKNILIELGDSIQAGRLINTHSILIAVNGSLVFEKYYEGYSAEIPHDTRSASKSITSAITGLAINKGYINNVNQKLYDVLPDKYKYTEDSDKRKAQIKIKDLLTMSSGIDAVDFGTDKESIAAEDNYQNTEDWAKTVLEAPMINEPGTLAFYGTANPFILGIALQNTIPEPLELFIHKNLFAPMHIKNYLIQNDINGKPYMGGGMFLTSRDMLKFGQMYLDKGKWNGERILSEEWINESFQKYFILENTDTKNDYGYLWWHNNYKYGNKTISSIEARGAGGQYIFVIPEYNLTAVITSGNFKNGRYNQPEKIMDIHGMR